jgi:hypothetical protein
MRDQPGSGSTPANFQAGLGIRVVGAPIGGLTGYEWSLEVGAR